MFWPKSSLEVSNQSECSSCSYMPDLLGKSESVSVCKSKSYFAFKIQQSQKEVCNFIPQETEEQNPGSGGHHGKCLPVELGIFLILKRRWPRKPCGNETEPWTWICLTIGHIGFHEGQSIFSITWKYLLDQYPFRKTFQNTCDTHQQVLFLS